MKLAILRFQRSLGRWHASCRSFFVCLVIAWSLSTPKALPVSPPPDGGYPGGNTAEGQNALLSLSSGMWNTAVGAYSLLSNTRASANTAIGLNALRRNTTGEFNTAVGVNALYFNNGDPITGQAINNCAFGAYALFANHTGINNTAIGSAAGANITGSGNICIGAGVTGASGEDNTVKIANNLPITIDGAACYIGGIYNQFVDSLTAAPVVIDASGKLGTFSSSGRFKQDIKAMNKTSEAILALRPVTFHYKHDANKTLCFGLIAEEVAEVKPDLVVWDKEGKPYSVRYDQVNAMLLNEFLKEHKAFVEAQHKLNEQTASIAALKSTVARQEEGMKVFTAQLREQAAQIQRVSAQLAAASPSRWEDGGIELSKSATERIWRGRRVTQVVLKNP